VQGGAGEASLIEERRGFADDVLPGCFAFAHGCGIPVASAVVPE
jgi:hypothetical protein